MIGRREFITLLGGDGGGGAGWYARTTGEKLPTIGFLGVGSPSTISLV